MNKKPIFVTQPYLPPLEEFIPYLEQIWENKQLTNGGPMHQQLERALAEYLGVPEVALFNNGTIALLTALKALDVTGEVITTPYSFVATSHSLLWNNLKPVFVDISPSNINLDPSKIEAAITSNTSAIMPVHCYGTPCIADKHKLKVIYDAAHAFGVRDRDGSILRQGNLSVLSFHATKVFNTFEGGAVVCPDAATKQRIDSLKNFGIIDEISVNAAGLNGKMSEINAAFGLLQLEHIDAVIARRGELDALYRRLLGSVKGIRLLEKPRHVTDNYSYFPIMVEESYPLSRDELYQKLKKYNIFSRRYFYPLISDFSVYQEMATSIYSNLPIATEVAKKILCLPIYADLKKSELMFIVDVIGSA